MKLTRRNRNYLVVVTTCYFLLGLLNIILIERDCVIQTSILRITVYLLGSFALGTMVYIVTKHRTLCNRCYIDKRTGLYTHEKLEIDLDELCNRKKPYGIYFLDLDNFKMINDTYGHRAGDEVLKFLATNIKGVKGVYCYRYGGDEFVLIAKDVDLTECEKTINSISGIHFDKYIGDTKVLATIEFSGAMMRYPEDGNSPRILLMYADYMQYENKRKKKNKTLQESNP